MIDISKKIVKTSFPLEVFGQEVKESMLFVASQYNIPVDFMGTVALFTLSSLSGGMYFGNANGGIKTMLYTMMIGPSGVGKTPAYRVLCSNIVKESFKFAYENYRKALDQWKIDERAAAKNGGTFDQKKPTLAVRMMTDGTPEGIIKKLDRSPCGFGVYYDEADKIYNLTKYRSGNGGATDFWNEIWNGDPYYDVKADDDREMYVHNPSISICVGVQPDALPKIITPESISKGLSSRMLFCESDYFELNEDIDPFGPKVVMCRSWSDIVSGLHSKGLNNFYKDDKPMVVNFTPEAELLFRDKTRELLRRSNVLIRDIKEADFTKVITSYNSKMSQYFGRFCLLMAIYENHTGPVITVECINKAELIHQYFFNTGKSVLSRIFEQHSNDMNATETRLFAALPDAFSSAMAIETCKSLGISHNYFHISKARGFSKKIKQVNRGEYEKV